MIELRVFNIDFLELSWSWLNDPEIKEKTNTPDFTKDQQLKWFNGLSSKSDYLVWGVTFGKKPIGVCGLKNITDTDCEYWGYIGEKSYWGMGLGNQIMQLMINKALELNLNSIWLKVKANNFPAVNLYNKFGFKKFKQNVDLIYMKKKL